VLATANEVGGCGADITFCITTLAVNNIHELIVHHIPGPGSEDMTYHIPGPGPYHILHRIQLDQQLYKPIDQSSPHCK